MQNSTEENLNYCKNLIRTVANARRLQLAFLPPELATRATAYYALDAELRHIHQHVSEEMIGHIRYAWWREAMDHIAAGKPQQHPVLITLAESGIEKDTLTALVDVYRETWPELPSHTPELAINHARWNKAGEIISRHRAKHGSHLGLIVRLLLV